MFKNAFKVEKKNKKEVYNSLNFKNKQKFDARFTMKLDNDDIKD